jgi:hypothetical protein
MTTRGDTGAAKRVRDHPSAAEFAAELEALDRHWKTWDIGGGRLVATRSDGYGSDGLCQLPASALDAVAQARAAAVTSGQGVEEDVGGADGTRQIDVDVLVATPDRFADKVRLSPHAVAAHFEGGDSFLSYSLLLWVVFSGLYMDEGTEDAVAEEVGAPHVRVYTKTVVTQSTGSQAPPPRRDSGAASLRR